MLDRDNRRASRAGRNRPADARVVLLDPAGWGSFATWGAALHHRGLQVLRVADSGRGVLGAAYRLRDRWLLGSPPVQTGAPVAITRALMDELLAPPTVDLHCSEDLLPAIGAVTTLPSGGPIGRVPAALWHLLGDKLAMTEFAEGLGLAVPRTTAEHDGTFPYVVKCKSGSAGGGVRLVNDQSELESARCELDPDHEGALFYQEPFTAAVVNAGGVARDGRLLVSAVYLAKPSPDDPLGPPEVFEILDLPGLQDELERLIEALGYTGIFCVDYVMTDDGRWGMVDVNSRAFGGWLALQVAGLDFLGAYLSLFDLGPEPRGQALPVGLELDDRLRLRQGIEAFGPLGAEWWRSLRAIRAASRATGPRYASLLATRSTVSLVTRGGRLVAQRLRGGPNGSDGAS
jgi:hypothetical protein